MLTLQQAQAYLAQASELRTAGKYNDAIALLEQATPIFEAAEDWEGYVECLNRWSEYLWRSGKYDEAIEKAEKALQICFDRWGEQHPYTASSYNNLGNCYSDKGNYDQAIVYHQQALSIKLATIGEQHTDIATIYTNLGICYQNKGDYAQAIVYHQQALSIKLATIGEQHTDIAAIYNNLGNCYHNKGNYTQAIAYHQQALSIYLVTIGDQHPNIAGSYNNLGICYYNKGDYTQAIAYHQQALTIWLAAIGEQHHHTAMSYNNLGVCYLHKGNYTQAIVYHQQALTISLSTIGKQHMNTAHSYNNLGVCYQNKGDYTQAIAYHQQALSIYLATIGEQHPSTATSYTNLGICYQNKGDYTQAIVYYKQTLIIKLATIGEQHHHTAYSYNNLGTYYQNKGDYTQAITYHQQTLSIYLATIGEQHPDTASSYTNLGMCHHSKGNYTQAITYYQQALTISLATIGEQHPDTAKIYYNLALLHHDTQTQHPQALHHHQLALQSLALNVPNDDYYPLPKLEGYNSAVELLEVLPAKANTLYALYHQNNNTQDLVATLAHYQAADQLIDQMRQSYKTEGSKLVLAEKGKTKVYDEGLYTAFEAQQFIENNQQQMNLSQFNQTLGYQLPERPIDLAFHFSEKSKAVLLLAGIKDAEARLNAQLPPDLAQQEYDLRVELTYLERRINEEGYKKDEEQDKTALNEWQSQHFDFKNQYDALIERLETEYPKYYQLKYDIQAATIAQIQAKLSPQKAMISYVLSEKYLYTFILTTTHSQWLQTELPADFAGLIEDFLLSFQSISKRDYITYGHDLYRHLILPALNTGALNHIQQLIIIPDGLLSRIPFEALLSNDCSDNTPYQNLPYLLLQFQISYHYSATLWLNQQTIAPKPQKQPNIGDFIGFAPIYSDTAQNAPEYDIDLTLPDDFYEKIGIEKPQEQHRLSYAPNTDTAEVLRSVIDGRNFVTLLHSETEVRKAAELFGAKGQSAKLLLHQKATLDNFKALAGKYRYILVSAHADYNDQKPDQTGIIFSPNESDSDAIFYMGDAYNLSLQADLVVLSCCETGLGNVQKGEGTMALNRGFLYSGAKNVIYTLFKVYDKESSELTAELFRALLSDLMPIAALRQAKLHLIKRGLMPNKWAGYVLVGE